MPRISPTYSFDPNATYLIAGGLGGIGRSVARWMASRGARNLILLSRSIQHSEAVTHLIYSLQQKGVRVETPSCDIAEESVLADLLLKFSRTMPPIKGCIQSSLALKVSISSGESSVFPYASGMLV